MAAPTSRRSFIARIGVTGAASLAWPLSLAAQQPGSPTIGWLNALSPPTITRLIAAFHQGLLEAGYVEGKNVAVDYRWADGHYERLPAMAAELVQRQVAVLFAVSPAAVSAAMAATTTIPIVFLSGLDPVKAGYVSQLGHPGGNVTGVSLITSALTAKRVELLRELVPTAVRFALLVNPANPNIRTQRAAIESLDRSGDRRFTVLDAESAGAIDAAFASMAGLGVDALVIGADPYFTSRREQIVALAARHAIPAIYDWPEYVVAGGLMSYGTSLAAAYRKGALYIGKILKGARPGDLPVVQSSTFELVINLRTAQALGLVVPRLLLARADQLIR